MPSLTEHSPSLPERGQPRVALCQLCRHQHACYATDRPGPAGSAGPVWLPYFACLGCLMRAADPAARIAARNASSPA